MKSGNVKIIDGKEWRLTLSGNVSGTKSNAEKTAKRMREMGYNARVIKYTFVSGRSKDAKGKTFLKIKKTRYDVFYRNK
jgi:hypothetical protein